MLFILINLTVWFVLSNEKQTKKPQKHNKQNAEYQFLLA